ncbi:metallophosphoesterase [Elizabethkingia anophelis]|uniref:metallophosphoesterase n=1 Tax=Elizabethkingia anophelis TaxID=1117645 RepID=UPI003892B555
MMFSPIKSALLLLFSISLCSVQGQEKRPVNSSDGPYVTYKGDSILVQQIEAGNQKKEHYLQKNKKAIKLRISFSDAPEKNFEVKLKQNISNEPSVTAQPKKMLVLSDIEGEFDALRELLLANKVINKKYEWTFGDGHLVICGDLFDRGTEVPATMWLLYKLEEEAKLKGGYVHTILGNHDIMNLAGNFKYVDQKYFLNAEKLNLSYADLYSEKTELGRWLRSKNLIEKIGDNLCMHGGISPDVNNLGLTIEKLNEIARPYIGWKNLKNTVTDATILKIFNSTDGIFWYRGYFKEPVLDEKVVDQTLSLFQVKRIIVGHTIVKTNIGFYYNKKVLGVDVNQHKGDHQAALFENNKWYKVGVTGDKILL